VPAISEGRLIQRLKDDPLAEVRGRRRPEPMSRNGVERFEISRVQAHGRDAARSLERDVELKGRGGKAQEAQPSPYWKSGFAAKECGRP
jgi:hypothetical protein